MFQKLILKGSKDNWVEVREGGLVVYCFLTQAVTKAAWGLVLFGMVGKPCFDEVVREQRAEEWRNKARRYLEGGRVFRR